MIIGAILASIVVIVAVVWFVAGMPGVPGGGTGDADLDEAVRLYNEGSYEEAADILRDMVADDDEDLDARRQLALVLAASGDNDGALAEYEAIVESDSGDHQSYFRMALIKRLLGDSPGAEADLESALEETPGQVSYRDELAKTKMQLGKYEEAGAIWSALGAEDTLGNQRRRDFYVAAGQAYQEARNTEAARTAWEAALGFFPEDEQILNLLAGLGDS